MEFEELRQRIDLTDKKILRVLRERFYLTEEVGEYKLEHMLNAQDKEREDQVFAQRKEWAEEFGLDPTLVKEIFELIINKVCEDHKNIISPP